MISSMQHIVFVVDDDLAITRSLSNLLSSANYQVMTFSSPQDFLDHPLPPIPCTLILDMNMPGADGFDVVEILNQRGCSIPTIFLTGFGTIPTSVRAMKTGAYEFFTKPVDPEQILLAVAESLKISAENMAFSLEKVEMTARYHSLTPRESELMTLAIGGLLNKQIAAEMGISEITAKVHKRRLMEKMNARSLSDLVRTAEKLKIVSSRQR